MTTNVQPMDQKGTGSYTMVFLYLLPPPSHCRFGVVLLLQLWEFANDLVVSRSTTVDKCLRSSTKLARARMFPGKGRRAVVYNSPAWHLTSVSMFSCMLKSWGFHVTAVVKVCTLTILKHDIEK